MGMKPSTTPKDRLLETIQTIEEHRPIAQSGELTETFANMLRGMLHGLIIASYEECFGRDTTATVSCYRHNTKSRSAKIILEEARSIISELWPDGNQQETFFSQPIFLGGGEDHSVFQINRLLGQVRRTLSLLSGLQQTPMSTDEMSQAQEWEDYQLKLEHQGLVRSIVRALGGEVVLRPLDLPLWVTETTTRELREETGKKLVVCGAIIEAEDACSIRWRGSEKLLAFVSSWPGVVRGSPYTTPEFLML